MTDDANREILNEAAVRELGAEVADTSQPREDDAIEIAEQFAQLANTMGECVVNALERSAASRPVVSLTAAAGFLFGQRSRGDGG